MNFKNITIFLISIYIIIALLMVSFKKETVNDIYVDTIPPLYRFAKAIKEEFNIETLRAISIAEFENTPQIIESLCSNQEFTSFLLVDKEVEPYKKEQCRKNGIELTSAKIGYHGLVLASAVGAPTYNISDEDLFRALAFAIPINGKLEQNPYHFWDEINPSLPHEEIKIHLPFSNSPNLTMLHERIMLPFCERNNAYKKQYGESWKFFCKTFRKDGKASEMGENETAILHKILTNPSSMAIVNLGFINTHSKQIQSALINGYNANETNIHNQLYPLAKPVYIYANARLLKEKGQEFLFFSHTLNENTISSSGYLPPQGIYPPNTQSIRMLQRFLLEL